MLNRTLVLDLGQQSSEKETGETSLGETYQYNKPCIRFVPTLKTGRFWTQSAEDESGVYIQSFLHASRNRAQTFHQLRPIQRRDGHLEYSHSNHVCKL